MSRETWIYPSDGSAPYRKGEGPAPALRGHGGVAILPDLPDFVSPIDGKTYHGRAGMRDHCARHDVVPVADLKGLPYLTTNSDFRSAEQRKKDAQDRKRVIINKVDSEYRKYNA